MKNTKTGAILILFIFAAFTIVSCDDETVEVGQLETNIDSVSYAFGYLTGSQMENQGMDTLNPELIAAGMKEAFTGDSTFIDRAKMIALMRSYQMEVRAQRMRQRMAQAEENKQQAQEFLAQHAEEEAVMTTESGLQYKVLQEGSGASPTPQDSVTVHYKGMLLSGEVFDSSYNGEPITFPLNGVIEGWTEGLQLMQEGAVYKFWIPGELAYGATPPPNSPIGPNELLVFKVELIEVE